MSALPKTPGEAVVEGYLETGKGLDVRAIAGRLGWSESRVRRSISAAAGCPSGCVCRQEHRASHERNYGTESGSHKVWVYYPTLETLLDMVNYCRG